jgi:DNA-3-methyladenine glycosylase II
MLVRIILAQQVSLRSAEAAFRRLRSGAGRVSADRLSRLPPHRIVTFGITRQKAGFIHRLAIDVRSGSLKLDALAEADDPSARSLLIRSRGIGPWTADIYLTMALRRPDVWPDGDLALLKSLKSLKGLRSDPAPRVVQCITAAWTPWRAVAARILWHNYLAERRRGARATPIPRAAS